VTQSTETTASTIPDFQADAQAVATYNDARVSYISREATDAEERTRTTFAKRRAAIRTEIDNAATLLYERKAIAEKALWTYALRYPLRVDQDTPTSPSMWEAMWSFGFANHLFKRAVVTAAEVVQAKSRRRRLEHDEDELDHQLQRTLFLEAEARKKSLEAPDGLDAFHAQPMMAELHARVEAIAAERAAFAGRLAAGDVSPPEQRDRDLAERQILPLVPPCDGVTMVRVARYGSLAYFILRDLESKLYALAYDPRLEPLIGHVVDIYWLVDSFIVRATAGPIGWPMTLDEHFAAIFKETADARSECRAARLALSVPRTDITPMAVHQTLDGQSDEENLVELLASFAGALPQGDASPEPLAD
jgi:hypothetical protein